jgi:hypothetical protein
MSVRLNHETFGTYETTNERKGTLYSTGLDIVIVGLDLARPPL